MRVPLPAQGAEDETPFAGALRAGDGGAALGVHGGVGVVFVGEASGVGVVAVGGQGGVVDHDGFEVEAAVAEVEDEVGGIVGTTTTTAGG